MPNPRILHPLMGCNFPTLVKLLSRNGFVSFSTIPHISLAIMTSLLRLPFSVLEKLMVNSRQVSEIPPPIFIVGHWRSGTTFLYNLLTVDNMFNYVSPLAVGLPWDFLLLGRIFQPFLKNLLPKDRFIDKLEVNLNSPQEDEIALANMSCLSFYHGLYFPERFLENFKAGIFFEGISDSEVESWKEILSYFYTKLYLQEPDKILLIKNPVYTARISILRSIWPDAKFIHIYRNPYVVFQSMRNFYVKLFGELGLQGYEKIAIDDVILDAYPRMMNSLFKDSADLPSNQFVELRFEDFEINPLSGLERIYQSLGLSGFEKSLPRFRAYLESMKGYQKNRYPEDFEANKKVEKYWGDFLDRWNYKL